MGTLGPCHSHACSSVAYQAESRALVCANRDVVAAVPMIDHGDGARTRRRQRVLQHRQQLDLVRVRRGRDWSADSQGHVRATWTPYGTRRSR